MGNLPTGTVTFLFTDIEGYTRQREHDSPQIQAALLDVERILRTAVEANGGYLYKVAGQTSQSAFSTAAQAVQAALDMQQALLSTEAERRENPLVKIALHTGITEERGDDYVGPLLNRVARLLAAGHGGQVLLTHATAMLAQDSLPHAAILEDLGEHGLKDLSRPERVYQLSAPGLGLSSHFPPLKTLQARPNNLPLQPTPFLGRDRALSEVRDTLCRQDVCLLVLTGPGGIGKTRLALQVAADLLDDFEDGVFFVPLASVNASNLVTTAIAQALGVREVRGRSLVQTLCDYLKSKHLLLVLDNFEHVIEAAAQVAGLLSSSPNLKVLVTGRSSLRLSMQHEYPVPPMRTPGTEYRVGSGGSAAALPDVLPQAALMEYESVQLFVQRAQSVKPDFELNDRNAQSVARICYRLEGIPLAIELAAARVRLFPPQALLARLGKRLDLLTGGARDLHARQQTLRNTIEWSYDLLTSGEKQLFRRMAVFRGGQTMQAAEAVCSPVAERLAPLEIDVLDGIGSLVDKSLAYEVQGPGGETRYFMLETINEYAWERLAEVGEAEALVREHALYFMRFAEEVEPELKGANQAAWLATVEAEHDNIRAALRWARSGDGEVGPDDVSSAEVEIRTAGAIWRFWYMRGYFSEGREELAAALAQAAEPGGSGPAGMLGKYRLKALNGAGVLANLQGDFAAALAFDQEGLALARELGQKQAMPSFLDDMGIMARQRGDYATARTLYEESLALRREIGDRRGVAVSLDNLGIVAREQGDNAVATPLLEEGLAIRRELADNHGIAFSLNNLGNLAQYQGNYELARSLLEESLALRREMADKRGIAISLNNLGDVALLQGDYRVARSSLEEGLALVRELGDRIGIAFLLNGLGKLNLQLGEYATARRLFHESLALRRETGDRRGMAASLVGLGGVEVSDALSTGPDPEGSTQKADGSTQKADDRRLLPSAFCFLPSVERGVTLMGAAQSLFEITGAVPDMDARLIMERTLSSARALLGEDLFDAAWAAGRALSVDEAAEYAL